MKKQFKSILFIHFLLLAVTFSAFGQEQKKKTISKKYSVSASDKLEIENRYGKVDVKTWDKKEVTVEVVVRAWAKSEEKAQAILDKIEIKHGQSGSVIRFETEINKVSVNGGGRNKGFEINYTVNVPADFDLDVENRYGDTFLADFEGELNIVSKYGSFTAQKITGSESKEIEVQYGRYDIEEITDGDLNFKYSSGEIGKAGNIDLYQGYGNISIKSVEKVDLQLKYGNFKADEAGRIEGSVGYSGFRLKKLIGEIDVEVKYGGGFEINEVAADFTGIKIEGAYCSFDISLADKTNFEYEISTSYGSFKSGLKDAQVQKEIIENYKQYHEGKVGSGGKKIHIETKYGNVRLDN